MFRAVRIPPRLRPGDRIAVAATAGPIEPPALVAGLDVLRGWDLEVDEDPGLLARTGFLAGDDARRREELSRCLTDDRAAGLWFARGGYGTMRTLEAGLDLSTLSASPRVLVGFSDLTPLLNRVAFEHGLVTVHGPTLAALGEMTADALDHLRALLFDPQPGLAIEGTEMLVSGTARAPLCGGNLSMLAHTLATPLAVQTAGRVLLIEEVGETPYRVDRLLTQLRMAGCFREALGVVVGNLSTVPEAEYALLAVVRERLCDLGIPVLLGLPVGHRPDSLALPLGATVQLDGPARQLVVETTAVA